MIELPDFVHALAAFGGGTILVVGILTCVMRSRMGHGVHVGGLAIAFVGAVIAASPFIVTGVINLIMSIVEPPDDSVSEPEPEPEPEPAPPAEPAEPMDLSVLWAILFGAAALAILTALGYGIYRVVTSSKRKRKAEKQTLAETAARWKAARDRHADAISTVASYELDVAKAIDYPAFNDVTVEEVSAMSKAMSRARDIEFQIDKDAEICGSDDLLVTYRGAVDDFVAAVAIAEAKAQQIRWKSIPEDERKLMKQAKNLLIQAEDPGNPEKMRHTLYQRLQKTIDQLNQVHGSRVVSTRTIGEIEEQTRLLLEAPEINVAEDKAHEAVRL